MTNKKKVTFHSETLSTSYSVDLNDILDVITLEAINDSLEQLGLASVDAAINGIDGVDKLEYNGHFGNAVYFRVDKEFDTKATHQSIYAILGAFMEKVIINDESKDIVLISDLDFIDNSINDSLADYANKAGRELQWIDEESNAFSLSYIGSPYHHEFKYRPLPNNKLAIYRTI